MMAVFLLTEARALCPVKDAVEHDGENGNDITTNVAKMKPNLYPHQDCYNWFYILQFS